MSFFSNTLCMQKLCVLFRGEGNLTCIAAHAGIISTPCCYPYIQGVGGGVKIMWFNPPNRTFTVVAWKIFFSSYSGRR